MRTRSWWAIGAGAYLAFALMSFPASTAYRWLAPAGLELAGLRGSVWSGQASAGAVAGIALHDIQWRIEPWAFLIGRLSADVEARFAEGFGSAHASATLGAIELSTVRASTDLASLAGALPSAALGATGLTSLRLDSLRLVDGWPVDADGELRVSELAVPPLLATPDHALVPLGEYRVVFTPSDGTGISANVSDTGGPLEVAAMLRLGLDRSYTLNGYARPRPDADPMLVQGLQLMGGSPDSSGRREFTLSGSL